MSLLFTPVSVGDIQVRNRAWVSPMCQYSCDELDGVPGQWHLEHLASFARGGAGLVMTEATAVEPIGRISPQDTGIWDTAQTSAWQPIVERIRAHGAVAGIQLSHAGRKGATERPWEGQGSVPFERGGWQTVAPSAIPFGRFAAPQAMSDAEISALPSMFADAARNAVKAGFEVIELHAAHGYLLHQFLSPLSNVREDAWGADDDGLRVKLLRAVTESVREAAPGVALMVRFSATDWVEGGIDTAMTSEHAKIARQAGADWFDISTGALDPRQQIPVGPGYQVPFARAVRHAVDAPVNAVGMIEDAEQAEGVIANGHADAVMLGRPWLRNPHWALEAESQLDGAPERSVWPNQYLRARSL